MTPLQRRFARAFQEKVAFVPMGAGQKLGQQAAGPGGVPVDPAMAGADPAAMGGAPMDPMAAGGAPMDPAMVGMPPADPMAAGGAPPVDPAAADPMAAMGGMPATDPAAADPMAGLPALPEEEPEAAIDANTNSADSDTDSNGKPDTMVPLNDLKNYTVGLIEAMKGKKTQDAADPNAKPAGGEAKADPASAPGPITGQPGFDPSMFGAPGSKLASVLARGFRR